ncbi:MAG TPA: hypothetical protein VLA43_00680 [Longimicrobiales bacterium]|nr:hypothetical protein [Longimicrobiales bacterium]
MSKAYFTSGVSSLFEMSTLDAQRILPPHLQPVEVRPQRSILNVSAFLFRDSQVGPYAELVFSVVVPPVVAGWSHHPKAGFFPFMAATSSPESRILLLDELRFPTHPDPIEARFLERTDHTRVQIWCLGDPVVDMTVTLHKWHDTTHYFHSFMMDGEQRLKADVQISGRYSMHEQEQGSLSLHPHAITRDLTLGEVSASPFREHWLKEGFELFSPLETL